MKIRGVDKSKHSRIPFQFPLVAPLFVRIPLDEFIVIINGVGDPRCIISSLSSRYCRGSRKIVYRRLKRKKKRIDEIVRISLGTVPRLIYLPFSSLECIKTFVGYQEVFRYVSFGNLRGEPRGLSFDES